MVIAHMSEQAHLQAAQSAHSWWRRWRQGKMEIEDDLGTHVSKNITRARHVEQVESERRESGHTRSAAQTGLPCMAAMRGVVHTREEWLPGLQRNRFKLYTYPLSWTEMRSISSREATHPINYGLPLNLSNHMQTLILSGLSGSLQAHSTKTVEHVGELRTGRALTALPNAVSICCCCLCRANSTLYVASGFARQYVSDRTTGAACLQIVTS